MMNKQETLDAIAQLGLLSVLRGPFPDIPLMPTGGVSKDNVADWFAAGAFVSTVVSARSPAEKS